MRIRRSVTRIFSQALLPAICIAVTCYFTYYAIWGERGVLVLQDTQVKLAAADSRLDRVIDERKRLEHRINLLKDGNPDPDLIEELARTQLMTGAPNQLAVPRDKQ